MTTRTPQRGRPTASPSRRTLEDTRHASAISTSERLSARAVITLRARSYRRQVREYGSLGIAYGWDVEHSLRYRIVNLREGCWQCRRSRGPSRWLRSVLSFHLSVKCGLS